MMTSRPVLTSGESLWVYALSATHRMTDDGMMGKRHVIGKNGRTCLVNVHWKFCEVSTSRFWHIRTNRHRPTYRQRNIYRQTDRQTDTLIAVVRTCISGEVKIHKDTYRLCFNHATSVLASLGRHLARPIVLDSACACIVPSERDTLTDSTR